MKISVELTLYPLQEVYIPHISGYIKSLHEQPEVTLRVNTMSTQIFGEYDAVMNAIHTCTKKAFESEGAVALVCKFLNTDRSEADF
jgi:uncharacterized protein YqgV (UPF0045/DUF77 family)